MLPYYISIGMTDTQFWDGDCRLAEYYRKAEELKMSRRNYELWLQGRYVYEAILGVAPVLHAFAKRTARPVPYLDEPFPITAKDVKERQEREERKRQEEVRAKMEAFMARHNARMLGVDSNAN